MIQSLDQHIRYLIEAYQIPGLAVGMVKDSQIIYTQGFGVKSLATNEPVTPESLFSLASISKTFVATALVQLAERGKIDLDAPLVASLPYFKLNDDRYSEITIRQMLSHVSGMPDIEDYLWNPAEYDDGSLERHVRSLASEKLVYAPGERFYYSNTAFDVLGDVIAKTSGQTFEAYIAEKILLPLGMENSTFLKEKVPPGLGTTPHVNVPCAEISPVYPYHRAHAPSGSLHSSVAELSNWAISNLNKGKFNKKKILLPSSHDLLWRPQAMVNEDDPDSQVGLSWFIGHYKGYPTISHSGGDVGFATNLVLLPAKSLGVVVLSNTYPAPVDRVTEAALDVLLGFEPQAPKVPAILPLDHTLKKSGLKAAIKSYHELEKSHPDAFDFGPGQFADTGYILVELKRYREGIKILKLGTEIHPEADTLRGSLAYAYLESGDKEQALLNAQQCLKLNPHNTEADVLIKKLS